MASHTIYHIPGRKIGCTDNIERRKKQYPEGTVFEIIKVLVDKSDKEAGDLEWFWADHFGYSRGFHYTLSSSAAAHALVEKLGPEKIKERNLKSRITMGPEGLSKRSKTNASRMSQEARVAKAKKISDIKLADREGCSQRQKELMAARSADEKSKNAFKGWETRRTQATNKGIVL